jgi:membrane-bound serine protease (ClpP class)
MHEPEAAHERRALSRIGYRKRQSAVSVRFRCDVSKDASPAILDWYFLTARYCVWPSLRLFKIIALGWFTFFVLISNAASQSIVVLPLNGAIGPAGADFVSRGIARAEKDNAQLVVLKMDTPGGLDTSMRQIIRAILSSKVPVASFVAPGGARAASAGTYILYASHIAAMAPGTNLGAATPVQIGMGGNQEQPKTPQTVERDDAGKKGEKGEEGGEGKPSVTQNPMTQKQVNDAAAYIRGLAQMRGRNAEWAERAVREAVSLPADEALQQNVIDVVARDVPALLKKVDGMKLSTAAGERVLNTAGANVVTVEPDWRTQLLSVVTNPSVALILMMIGVYGLLFEFYSPGFVLPGVVGAICLMLGLFALQLLPISYAGLALIVLGLAFMLAEAFLPSFGVLGIGGVIAFAFGAVMLIDTDIPGFGIPLSLIAGVATVSALFIFFVATMALQARRQPVVTGQEELLGSTGVTLEDIEHEGWALVHGEHWQVRSTAPLKRDQKIRIVGREGLVLAVTPANQNEIGGVS